MLIPRLMTTIGPSFPGLTQIPKFGIVLGASGFRDRKETDVLQVIYSVSLIAKRSGFSSTTTPQIGSQCAVSRREKRYLSVLLSIACSRDSFSSRSICSLLLNASRAINNPRIIPVPNKPGKAPENSWILEPRITRITVQTPQTRALTIVITLRVRFALRTSLLVVSYSIRVSPFTV